jgi:hypothetical protein
VTLFVGPDAANQALDILTSFVVGAIDSGNVYELESGSAALTTMTQLLDSVRILGLHE